MNRITNTNSSLKKNNTVKQNNSIKQNNTVKTNIVPLQTSTTGYSNSSLIGIVILVIIIIVFAGSAYWLYNYYSTRSFITAQKVEVLSDITDATNKTLASLANGFSVLARSLEKLGASVASQSPTVINNVSGGGKGGSKVSSSQIASAGNSTISTFRAGIESSRFAPA